MNYTRFKSFDQSSIITQLCGRKRIERMKEMFRKTELQNQCGEDGRAESAEITRGVYAD